ncbi:unnamed protein product [Sphagnum jensenii]|uniref:DNA-directed primase/polymerase protein n=1 Tax=Sphagnum jensenii TaxID=128206 RepID=A0ABP1B2X6_9BRYO
MVAPRSETDVQRLWGCLKRGLAQRSPPSGHCSSSSRKQQEMTPLSPQTPVGKTKPSSVAANENATTGEYVTPGVHEVTKQGRRKNEVSPGVFYGSPTGNPSRRPFQVVRLLHEIQNDLALQKAPKPREAIWATFPRQDQAIQFTESHGGQDLAVFQYQDHLNGQRRFLATSYDEFWHRYSKMQREWRHHYEIIRQGRPCHLYFDLEYNLKANRGADGEGMVDTLLSVIQSTLLDTFSLEYDASWTVELDSSTPEKFSRHLIIHIPGAAFKDNSHVGAFVGELCTRINSLRDSDDRIGRLFVLQGDSRADYHTSLFIDLGVYTRNRSFRLPFSSKAGKTALLLPTRRFRCSNLGEYQVFMDSLICRLDQGCLKLLTFGNEVRSMSWKPEPTTALQEPGISGQSGKSPFPSLEVFVESIACIGDVQGRIRSWYWFSEHGVVVYNITGNRFCERIGRQHKSNNVMYIVDFRTAGFYQKCHDPDCRGYQSPLRPIPRHTIPPQFPLSTASVLESQQAFTLRSLEEGGGEIQDGDDKAWWDEVVSTVANMQCASQSQISSDTTELSMEDDEEWWDAVERETQELERSTISRTSGWPS